ncbi:MAG: hypothetical protein MI923_09200 [Phycisphaerales bacterium]|nr:hypothetical protein [Phycisphaerales bacterium]
MKQPSRKLAFAAALLMTSGVITSGCDTTIGDLLNGLNLNSETTIGDLLSVLTSGDLADGFDQFVANANGRFAGGDRFAGLTPEQTSAVEDLQAQLNSGAIDSSEFAQQIREVLGDRAPNLAFGGFGFGGSPFGFGRGIGRGDPLDLSDEQKEQARAIFEELHSDISDLRSAAHEDIQAILTAEQLATLEERRSERIGFPGLGGRRAGGFRNGGNGSFSERFAEELGLSEQQQADLEDIRETLRASVKDRHTEAREVFIALLTPEQIEVLEELEAERDGLFGDKSEDDGE